MATTENIVLGDGGNTYSFSFPYLKTEDVRVELQEYDPAQPIGNQVISVDDTAAFTIDPLNPTQIIFSAIGADTVYQTAPDGDVKVTSTNGKAVRVRIYRVTPPDSTPATFFAGSAIRAQDLNDNFEQILYIMQEKENQLTNIKTEDIQEGAISTDLLQDDSVTAAKLRDSASVDGDRAVTTNHIRDNAVTTAKIADGTIVDGDVNASAAIAGTKISPNFGAQNTVTTGNNTAASFIPTSSTVPTNGLYLPSANSVALSTNSTGRLFISDDGKVGIGVADPSNYNPIADDLIIASPGGGNTGIQINITDNVGFSSIYFGDSDAQGIGAIIYGHGGSDAMNFVVSGGYRAQITSTGTFNIVGAGSIGSTQAVSFNGSAPVDSMVVNSSGYVGVNTNTPVVNLHVKNTALTVGALFESTSANSYIRFADTTGQAQIGNNGNDFVVRTFVGFGDYERLRITSAGQLSYIGSGSSGSPAVSFNSNAPSSSLVVDSGGRILIGASTNSGSSPVQVNGDKVSLRLPKTPASASDTGTTGEICWDFNYVYVCVATNTWKRSALSTW